MGNNKCTGQLIGPFQEQEELIGKIKVAAATNDIKNFKHLGIQCHSGSIVILNNNEIEIGMTGKYEVEKINVLSLKFLNKENNAIIDYVIEI